VREAGADRPEVVGEVAHAPAPVRQYVSEQVRTLLATRTFHDALAGFLLQTRPAKRACRILMPGSSNWRANVSAVFGDRSADSAHAAKSNPSTESDRAVGDGDGVVRPWRASP
jgi:hypothetical protein